MMDARMNRIAERMMGKSLEASRITLNYQRQGQHILLYAQGITKGTATAIRELQDLLDEVRDELDDAVSRLEDVSIVAKMGGGLRSTSKGVIARQKVWLDADEGIIDKLRANGWEEGRG